MTNTHGDHATSTLTPESGSYGIPGRGERAYGGSVCVTGEPKTRTQLYRIVKKYRTPPYG